MEAHSICTFALVHVSWFMMMMVALKPTLGHDTEAYDFGMLQAHIFDP